MKKEYFIMIIIFISTITSLSIIFNNHYNNLNDLNHNDINQNCVVAISFDDGYIEQYQTQMWLEEQEIYSTIYIPTNYIGKIFEDYYQIIDWDKIEELNKLKYSDIQTHGTNHINLNNFSYKEIIEDINNSIKEYNKHNISVEVFAKPYGSGKKILKNISKDLITTRTNDWDFTTDKESYIAIPITQENYKNLLNSIIFNQLKDSKNPMIFMFHRVTNDINNSKVPFRYDTDITFDYFKEFIKNIKNKDCKIVLEKDIGDYINE